MGCKCGKTFSNRPPAPVPEHVLELVARRMQEGTSASALKARPPVFNHSGAPTAQSGSAVPAVLQPDQDPDEANVE